MHVTLAKPHETAASPKAFDHPAKSGLISLLRQLKSSLRISELDPDQEQVTLSIDDHIVSIDLTDAGEVEFYAAERMDTADEALLKEVLAGNLMGNATGGGLLALYGDWLTLTRRLPLASLDYRAFIDALESFVNHWEYWHKRLQVKPKPASPQGRYTSFA
jgi:hypothetical protein